MMATPLSQPIDTRSRGPHPNLLLGSLQLLLWIGFYPSAWVRWLAAVAPGLRPDFTLLDLLSHPRRGPVLQRLLSAYLVYVPLTLLGNLLLLLALNQPTETVIVALTEAVLLTVLCFVLGGLLASVPVGIIMGFPGSLVAAVRYTMLDASSYPLGIPLLVLAIYGLMIGLTGGLASSVAANVSRRASSEQADYWVNAALAEAKPSRSARLSTLLPFPLTTVAMPEYYSPARMSTRLSGVGAGIVLGAIGIFAAQTLVEWMVSNTFGGSRLGGIVESLPLAFALLLVLIIPFLASVEWERARVVLLVVAAMFGGIGLLLFGFAQVDFRQGIMVAYTLAFIAVLGLPYTVVSQIVGQRIGGAATAIGLGVGWITWLTLANGQSFWEYVPLTVLAVFIGATLSWWGSLLNHPLLEVWNLLVIRSDERRAAGRPPLLHFHTAFWNESHRLPFYSLYEYLLQVAAREPAVADAAIEQLSGMRYQLPIARSVQIEIDARRLEQLDTIEQIAAAAGYMVTGDLESPVGGLLRRFRRIAESVAAALSSATIYHRRLALSTVEDNLDVLLREMTLSADRYAQRFRPVASRWRQVISDYIRSLTTVALQSQELDNPYIFSLPLAEHQELFVGRADVAARIEQLIVDRRRPPLLLYGQRRMGKTSLLRNLGRLLPSSTVLLFVDGEGISGASGFADFLYAMASAMVKSADQHRQIKLPAPSRQQLTANPFTAFNEWLDQVEQVLDKTNSVALLALDEFEALRFVLDRGRFEADDLLRLLRNLIQHRRLFKVLLAGSHTIDEFRQFAGQLINMQVIKISYLAEPDALALIENPVKDFALRYAPEASRYVLELTRGHPHLVQLLCYEIVELKNQGPPEQRLLVTVADVEAAVLHALATGDFFFADLSNQIGTTGLAILQFIASLGPGAAVTRAMLDSAGLLDKAIALLLRRDLIEEGETGYRFQVELIRRWFAQAAR